MPRIHDVSYRVQGAGFKDLGPRVSGLGFKDLCRSFDIMQISRLTHTF